MPPEIIAALVFLAVTAITGIGSFVTTFFYMVREFGKIKVQQEKQDNDKDKIINTFVVDFNKRLEDKDQEIKELRNNQYRTEVELREKNAKLEGMVEANTENHNMAQARWIEERKELIAKIEHLEREMTELRREKELHIEEIRKVRDERDKYKRLLEERDRLVLDQSGDINRLELALQNCQKEKQAEKKKTSELDDKIKELVQPKPEEKKEDIA